MPNYIINSSGYNNRTASVEGENTFIPDWSSQDLMDFNKEFFTEFAKRYDNDSRLAFLQIGFGSYSEYHLYDGPNLILGDNFPSKNYQTEFLYHVNSVFKETPWTISIDASSDSYSPMLSNSSLRDLSFGLFDDSFLHSEHSKNDNEYNRESWLLFGEDRANENVAGGELNYYSDYDQEHVLDEEGPYNFTFEELAKLYDISYMIGNDQLNYQTQERIEEASLATGYHYEVTEFKTNGSITEVTVKNNGIAPIYFDAYFAVGNTWSTESLKGLIAGQSKTFLIDKQATNEELTIESDRLVEGQEIQFDANLDGDNSVLSMDDFSNVIKDVTVFPNPFLEKLTVKNKSNETVELIIYNLLGAIVKTETINSTTELDTSKLTKGIYLVELNQKSLKYTKVFVKK